MSYRVAPFKEHEYWKEYLNELLPVDWLTGLYSGISFFLIVLRHKQIGDDIAWKHAMYHLMVIFIALYAAPRIGSRKTKLINNPIIRFLRLWYPAFLWGFMYNWTQPVDRMFFSRPFDDILIAIDTALFGFEPSRELFERWGQNKFITEYLTASYLAYYALVAYLPMYLYLTKRMREFLYVSFVISLLYYSCYMFYQIFPAEGPIYYQFGGQHVTGGPISEFAAMFLGKADIPGAAFPSSHVAGSVAMLLFAYKFWRKAFYVTLPLVLSLWLSTVYCRFHYAIDGIIGAIVAVIMVYYIGPYLYEHIHSKFLAEYMFIQDQPKTKGKIQPELHTPNNV